MRKYFPRLNKSVQNIAGWLAVLSVVYTALTQNSPKFFGALNWPESILLGIGLALATLLTASVLTVLGAHAFRLIKPLPQAPLERVTVDHLAASGFMATVEHRLDRLEGLPGQGQTPLDALRSDMKTMSAQMDKVEGIASVGQARLLKEIGRVEAVEGSYKTVLDDYQRMRASLESMTQRLDEQRTWLQSIESGQSQAAERLEALLTREAERVDALIKKLDEKVSRSFYALRTKEALDQIATDIEADADILYARFANGETYDAAAWDKWENVHYHWIGLIRTWIEHGKWYFGNLTTAVIEVPDHKYRGDWTVSDSQFPNAEAVRVFKKFRIIQTQWQEVRDKVRENLYYVAYHGMSDVEVRHGEPAR
jgi:hypothetical protein